MKPLPRFFLIISVPALLIGALVSFSGIRFAPVWSIAWPAGVICLGVFGITRWLQKESARFDEEHGHQDESPAHQEPPETDGEHADLAPGHAH